MSSNHNNEKVPFDVLGIIFAYYAEKEDIVYSLETLLLVCRAWSAAAIGHRTLWTSPKIYIGHEPNLTIWDARLPLRLSRCGPDSLFDISLRLFECSGEFCGQFQCEEAAQPCFERLLQLLTGENGEKCARWRSFTLQVGHMDSRARGNAAILIALAYPTPNLRSLHLKGVQPSWQGSLPYLLPHCPSLECITLLDCDLGSLPNFDGVLDAVVGWCKPPSNTGHLIADILALQNATSIHTLSIRLSQAGYILLPSELRQLQVLRFSQSWEGQLSNIWFDCKMPQLSQLEMSLEDINIIYLVFGSRNWEIERLKRLKIVWAEEEGWLDEVGYGEMKATLHKSLSHAKGLMRLTASGNLLCVILAVLWEALSHGPRDAIFPRANMVLGEVDLSGKDGRFIQFDGTETPEDLERLAGAWGLQIHPFE